MIKPKVFLLIPGLNKGGAERVISILSNSLSARGYQVYLILLNYTKHSYVLSSEVEVVYLNRGSRRDNFLNRSYNAAKRFCNLASLVKNEKPDVMISFITSANMWTGVMGNLFNIPYVVSERSNPDKTFSKLNGLMRSIIFELYKRAKAVVLPSKGMLTGLANNNFSQLSNVISIMNPVSTFKAFSVEKIHPRKFILAVGRLQAVKGFDRLISAYKNLGEIEQDLLIVGEGPERAKLQKQIDDAGLTNKILLVGAKDNIQDYYRQCELFVLSSHYEGYPNVLVEAMSLGCPVISVDCQFGPRDIIENEQNGLLVPQNDVQKLTDAISRVLTDEGFRARISDNAMLVAQTNSIDAVVDQWEQLILADAKASSAVA